MRTVLMKSADGCGIGSRNVSFESSFREFFEPLRFLRFLNRPYSRILERVGRVSYHWKGLRPFKQAIT